MGSVLAIKKDEETEIPVEVFEQAIVDLSRGFRKLANSRLSKRAVILLVQDAAGVGLVTKAQVEAVLDAASDLERRYLKKK